MENVADKNVTIQIEPILPYLFRLVDRFPAIESVWLFGSRANESARNDSDWDLLVFANQEIFDALAADISFCDETIDLLVVFDGDNFAFPYGGKNGRKSKQGSLKKWEWRHFSLDLASYKACKAVEGLDINIEKKSAVKIWPNQKISFHEYLQDYSKAQDVTMRLLSQTTLPKFEELTLRLMHGLETKQLKSFDEQSEEFFNTMMCKLTNECLGFIGCLKAGADLAAYHHTRAVWELYAAMNYTLGDDSKRDIRLQRFNEFHSLQQHNHYLERSKQLSENKISKEEFDHTCHVSREKYEMLKQNVSKWSMLWDVKEEKLSTIKHWHGRTIQAMFDTLDEDSNTSDMYGYFCHGTHLSPSGRRMTSGLRLIGFSRLPDGTFDLRSVENLVGNMILALQNVLLFLFKNSDNPLIWEIINHEVQVVPITACG